MHWRFVPDAGRPVGLKHWTGVQRLASLDDFGRLNRVLDDLKLMRSLPGYLEVQNINALARGENNRLQAILDYVQATYKKYEWDFLMIDPFDSCLPPGTDDKNGWKTGEEMVNRLFDFSRDFAGGRGIMVVTSAQFKVGERREIEKWQAKNGGQDRHDDEIESVLRRDSAIQYFTTIGQRFDLGIGCATHLKNGDEGSLVQGRSREGGNFDTLTFVVERESNYMREKTHREWTVDGEPSSDPVWDEVS
jgi:hypothetical protein